MAPKITIVGLQHQGVIQAVCFASMGYQVIGVDDNYEAIRILNEGRTSLNEPGLEKLIQEQLKTGRLTFTTNYDEALVGAEFVFLSQDIEFDEIGVDVLPIYILTWKINCYREAGSILCVTTQVPVGTSEQLTVKKVVYIPEFLRPGKSLEDFMNPDRIVIGTNDEQTASKVATLYWPVSAPIIVTDLRSAEMIKHAHNAMLATQISFANEIGNICKKVGADPQVVARGIKFDHRVGRSSYVNPGWTLSGGHLIRDVRVLQNLGCTKKYKTPLLDAVVQVEKEVQNDTRR